MKQYTSGIYRIKNIINNKCYYGSSKHIQKRFNEHINKLKNNKHINIILQRALNKYGENNFIFEIVEECSKELLLKQEQIYLNLKPKYNIAINSSGGDNLTNNPNRLKIIQKITKSIQKRLSNMSLEERQKLFSKIQEQNPNLKGGLKICKCGNKISYKGKTVCIHCINKNGKFNGFYGKHHTNETKEKLSKKRLGKNNNYCNKPIIIDNIEYRTCKEAATKLNIKSGTIQHRLNSKNINYKNYYYKNTIKIFETFEERRKKLLKNKQLKSVIIDNIEYISIRDANEKLNIKKCTIHSRIKNKNYPNYFYKYENKKN